MKARLVLLTVALALTFTACTADTTVDTPVVSENTVSTDDSVANENSSIPAEPGISLVYLEQDSRYEDENDFIPDNDQAPEEYLKESVFYQELYFVKLYEADYSEDEIIDKVYRYIDNPSVPEQLPDNYTTVTRCPDGKIPSKHGESNFLPEGAKVYVLDDGRYMGTYAAAVYDADEGKKMTVLVRAMFRYDEEQAATAPSVRALKRVYLENVGYLTPQMDITREPNPPKGYLAARYYSDSADVTQDMIDGILSDAEYIGEISSVISRNIFVARDLESNFLPQGTRIYTIGEEAIALLPKPQLDEENGKYIVAVRLFRPDAEINIDVARELYDAK